MVRFARAFGYATTGVAGLLLLYGPGATLLSIVMSWFLIIGSLCSSIGAVTRRWSGEFIGIPLTATALISMGLIALSNTRNGYTPTRLTMPVGSEEQFTFLGWGVFLFFLGYALLLVARWRVVLSVCRVVMWLEDHDESDEGA